MATTDAQLHSDAAEGAAVRLCQRCKRPLPVPSRSDRKFCRARCRRRDFQRRLRRDPERYHAYLRQRRAEYRERTKVSAFIGDFEAHFRWSECRKARKASVEVADAFLRSALRSGPKLSASVKAGAADLGITPHALRQAREQLRVVTRRVARHPSQAATCAQPTTWELP
jgi:hypothetical protein